MSGRSSPPFDGLAPRPDEWDVVVKVKFGDTLKRFNGYVNGPHFNLNLSALRSKIAGAFKFGPDADFILTYTDEDGDVVMLDDDDDLHDAAIHQKLNPLRINVQLKNTHAGTSENKQQDSNATPLRSTTQEDPLAQIKSVIDEALKPISKPLRSTAREDPLAQIKSAIDEAMKFIPEPVPDALAKLSHEVLDAAPPQLSELINPFVKLITPNSSNNRPSDEHAGGSSSFSSGVPQTQVDLKANDETKVKANLGSRPLDAQNSESSEARGLKSVLVEAPVAPSAKASQGQASLYPSIEELLFSINSGGNNSVCKGMSDTQSKGKSVMPSAAPPAPSVVPTFCPTTPIQSSNEWSQPRRCEPKVYPSIWQSEANAKAASDSRWRIPMYRAPHAPPPVPHAPLGYGPSPRFPYPGRLLSSGHLYGDLGNNSESSPPHTFHRWIQCDGCGVQPIVGPRYKSNVKEDYDLCDACFHRMGNEVEYTRIDKPILPHRLSRDPNLCRKIHSRSVMKSKREKLESRFILDVTVLDGTLMAPSTPFIKIWRMHNNGSIMWPLGTQLIWVGGDQFALQTSVPLEIPVNGFPVDEEIDVDVDVDFVAPARPGRYISYWRLASPTGQKFGQRVWVSEQQKRGGVHILACKLRRSRISEASKPWETTCPVSQTVGQISSCSALVHDKYLQVPWDPGGNCDDSFASAWGQAEFQGGKNVIVLLMGCRCASRGNGLGPSHKQRSCRCINTKSWHKKRGGMKIEPKPPASCLLPHSFFLTAAFQSPPSPSPIYFLLSIPTSSLP